MARVSTYLNFMGCTEEAFEFYASVFKTEPSSPIVRFADLPADARPGVTEAEQRLVVHVELPILAGHVLMGTDMLESMGQAARIGNNVTINLEPDNRDEADRLFSQLSQGASESAGMQEMPWGYWGTCLDKYGIRWMVNATSA